MAHCKALASLSHSKTSAPSLIKYFTISVFPLATANISGYDVMCLLSVRYGVALFGIAGLYWIGLLAFLCFLDIAFFTWLTEPSLRRSWSTSCFLLFWVQNQQTNCLNVRELGTAGSYLKCQQKWLQYFSRVYLCTWETILVKRQFKIFQHGTDRYSYL